MTLKKSLSLKENKCFYIPVDKLNQITRIDKGLQLLHIAEQLKTKLFKHSQRFYNKEPVPTDANFSWIAHQQRNS